MPAKILGIDIGASGVKAAPVDMRTGKLLAARRRIKTPTPSKPQAIATAVTEMVRSFKWKGLVGCGLPARITNGVVQERANLDESWIGTDARALFESKANCPFVVLNDADAAGIAEMTFGAGKQQPGIVVVITFGTGIGSALFHRGQLLPNVQLGELCLKGRRVGRWASDAARDKDKLSWKRWAKRVNRFLAELERIVLPDLIVIGGGASNEKHKFFSKLHSRCAVVAAEMRNDAGIIGAALAARTLSR
jgi:polyphosphate glucokinase